MLFPPVLIILALFLSSCGKEQFSTSRKVETTSTSPIQLNSSKACSSFTLIKPQVDFLFLWDNSSSTTFINNSTKTALNNTIDSISSRFDYHILLAPLVGSGNGDAKFVSETPVGLGSAALGMKIDRSQAANSLNFSSVQGTLESGVERVRELLSLNSSNGVFRQNAYTVVVVMSNEDDNSWINGAYPTSYDRDQYVKTKLHQILCLRGNYYPAAGMGACSGPSLNSLQMRFISLVAKSDKCGGSQPTWDQNRVYKEMSSKIYTSSYSNGTLMPTDQGNPAPDPDGIVPFDTYDICNSDFTHLFDGVNSSIQDTLIKHKYDYWPVATSSASAIDPNEVKVFKDGVEQSRLNEPVVGAQNGFSFTNMVQTQDTRYEPSPGEPFTGYLVRLYGNARVTYPECMTVTTQTPKEYYGYIALQAKPAESTITLKINGISIPQSATNGWQLVKSGGQPLYFSSKNIKITGPGQFCPSSSTTYCAGSPADLKSGYMIQLMGNAVYSNGAAIELNYLPAAN